MRLGAVILGFFLGVVVASFFDWGLALVGVFTLMAIVLALLWVARREGLVLVVALLFLGLAMGVLRMQMHGAPDDSHLASRVDARIELDVVIIDEPDVRESYQRLRVKSDDERVLVTTSIYPRVEYGDGLRVTGVLSRPRNRHNLSGDDRRDFDWVAHLAKDQINYEMFYPKIRVLNGKGVDPQLGNRVSKLRGALFSLKVAYAKELGRLIEEPQASLLAGLTVGAKTSMGKELLEDFRRTGLIHIVVLSGYNMMIVAVGVMALLNILKFIPRRVSFILAILSIILFATLTGGGPTVVRASIMATLALVATQTGHSYAVTRALVAAALLMVLYNPAVLVHDVGFQLSFIATLGLIYLAPVIEYYIPGPEILRTLPFRNYFNTTGQQFKDTRPTGVRMLAGARELVIITIAAQLAVLPWLLYTIGDFSLVAIPANLLVLAVVPVTMLLGLVVGTVGFVSLTLATPFAWLAHLLLSYVLLVVSLLSGVPFASVSVPSFSFALALLVYCTYAWLVRKHCALRSV